MHSPRLKQAAGHPQKSNRDGKRMPSNKVGKCVWSTGNRGFRIEERMPRLGGRPRK